MAGGWEDQRLDKINRMSNFQNANIPIGTNYNNKVNLTQINPRGSRTAPRQQPYIPLTPSATGADPYGGQSYIPLTPSATGADPFGGQSYIPFTPLATDADPFGGQPVIQMDGGGGNGYQPISGPNIDMEAAEVAYQQDIQSNLAASAGADTSGVYGSPASDIPAAPEMGGWDKAKIGGQLLTSGMNAYLGYQGLQEAKENNAFNRKFASKQLGNQVSTIEDNVRQRARASASREGGDAATRGDNAVSKLNLKR